MSLFWHFLFSLLNLSAPTRPTPTPVSALKGPWPSKVKPVFRGSLQKGLLGRGALDEGPEQTSDYSSLVFSLVIGGFFPVGLQHLCRPQSSAQTKPWLSRLTAVPPPRQAPGSSIRRCQCPSLLLPDLASLLSVCWIHSEPHETVLLNRKGFGMEEQPSPPAASVIQNTQQELSFLKFSCF